MTSQALGSITYGWRNEDSVPSAVASNPAMVYLAAPIQRAAYGLAESIFQAEMNASGTPVFSTKVTYNGVVFDLQANQMQSAPGGQSVVVNVAQEQNAQAAAVAASAANPNRGLYLNNGNRYFLTASQPGLTAAQLIGGNPFWTSVQAKSAGNTSVATATWAGATGANAVEVVPQGVMVTLAQHVTVIDTTIEDHTLGMWREYTGEVPRGLGREPIKHDGQWIARHGNKIITTRVGLGAGGGDYLSTLAQTLLTALANSAASNPNAVNAPGVTACSDPTVAAAAAAFQAQFNLSAATNSALGKALTVTGMYDQATVTALNSVIGVYTPLGVTFTPSAAPPACTGPGVALPPAAATTSTSGIQFPNLPVTLPTTTTPAPATPTVAVTSAAPAPDYTPIIVTGAVLGLGVLAYFAFKGKGK